MTWEFDHRDLHYRPDDRRFDRSNDAEVRVLLREGENRTIQVDVSLAIPLAAIAGAVNTAAFRAVGHFSANMTGNVSSVSDSWATSIPKSVSIPETCVVRARAFDINVVTAFCSPMMKPRPTTNKDVVPTAGRKRSASPSRPSSPPR